MKENNKITIQNDSETRLLSLKRAIKEAQEMVKHYTGGSENLTQE